MTVNDFINRLGLEVLNLDDGEREITGGYTGDLLSWVMSRAQSGDAWVTIMTNINVIAVASLTDVACVIIAENAEVAPEIIERAKAQGINLLRTDKTAWRVCSEPLK
ncbi:MAG: hypothetical protein IJD17_06445 [Clostridia bacterium]|nr:hypothetical protein [Clostridia bacterium]